MQEPLPHGHSVTPASISNPLAAETNTEEAHSRLHMEAFSEGNRNWLAHPKQLMGKLTQPSEYKMHFIQTTEGEALVHLPSGRGLHAALISSGSAFYVCVCVCVCMIFKVKIKCKHTYNKLSQFIPLPECTIWCSFGHSLYPYGLPSLHQLVWE